MQLMYHGFYIFYRHVVLRERSRSKFRRLRFVDGVDRLSRFVSCLDLPILRFVKMPGFFLCNNGYITVISVDGQDRSGNLLLVENRRFISLSELFGVKTGICRVY